MQSFSLLTILATSLISLTSGAPTPGLICSSVKPLAGKSHPRDSPRIYKTNSPPGSVFNLMLFDKIKSRNWASWTNMPDGPWAGSSNPPFPYLGPTNGGSQCYSFGKILNEYVYGNFLTAW